MKALSVKYDQIMNTTLQQTDTYREVIAWLRGGDATPDEKMEGRFIDIVAQLVAEKLEKSSPRPRRRRADLPPSPLSIKAIMKEIGCSTEIMKPAEKPQVNEELKTTEVMPSSTDMPLDSVLLAKALQHMALIEGVQLTMSQIQTILYIAYGVNLAKHGERLTEEHPQMWQYGPVFPRVYAKLKKESSDGFDEYDTLLCQYPDKFRFLSNCFRRFAWTKSCILTSPHVSQGSPWADTRKENPDRWGVRIEDELIREWFLPRV